VVTIFLITGISLAQNLSPKEQLGKFIFFDANLSTPAGQSCATCHGQKVGFTGPNFIINIITAVYPGAIPTRFGNRKPPSSAYGGASPILCYDSIKGIFVGGMFWDGRATGWELGDPLAEQARGPFLNPVEQNNASKQVVVNKIHYESNYANLFQTVYGNNIWNDINNAYNKIADAISAYERSTEINPFTSKFDYYLKGWVTLTRREKKGYRLFKGKGNCDNCHLSQPGQNGEPPMFTDFTYDNLGVPKNLNNPYYLQPPSINPDGINWIDKGLGGFLQTVPEYSQYASENYGKQKVPTLRNVDKRPFSAFVKAYGHNGYFKSLKSIVHFYNTRDVESWPPPEVSENVNTTELGNLGLTSEEEDDIIAFLKTLTDGYIIPITNINQIGTEVPTQFRLNQNYPNPFNPTTKIKYGLPKETYVKLVVYDMLGREIKVLVNETQKAGVYEATFNASSLASGVYFFRLITDGFIETKKMILMK
jgi:cytochrome c peroxidase